MPIYYVDENPTNKFYEEQIPNGKYRYLGCWHGVSFSIHAKTRKTKEEIFEYLESRSIESLVNSEGYIIDIE